MNRKQLEREIAKKLKEIKKLSIEAQYHLTMLASVRMR